MKIEKKDFNSRHPYFEKLSNNTKANLKKKVLKNKPKDINDAKRLLQIFIYEHECQSHLMPYDEIALVMGLSSKEVATIASQALEKLRIICERNNLSEVWLYE